MLTVLALTPSAKIAIVLMAGIVAFSLMDLYLRWLAKHRRRMRKELMREALSAQASVLSGLRTMAGLFTDLPEHPLELSVEGVHLLDSQARAADSFDKLCRRYPTMSRERKSRQLLRVLSRLRHQEERFEDFQKDILRTVSDQVRRGIVSPPVPGRSYRAVFSVLDHELPEPLWPAMEEVLANGVTLRMQDVDGHWHPVPLRFAGGAKAVFNRKHLERAVSLQIIIKHGSPDREMFEYAVQHELPVKPMWSMKQRFLRWIASRSPGSMMSPMGGDCSISKGKSQSKA